MAVVEFQRVVDIAFHILPPQARYLDELQPLFWYRSVYSAQRGCILVRCPEEVEARDVLEPVNEIDEDGETLERFKRAGGTFQWSTVSESCKKCIARRVRRGEWERFGP